MRLGFWGHGAGVYCLGVALNIVMHRPNFANSIQPEQEKNGTTPTAMEVTLYVLFWIA